MNRTSSVDTRRPTAGPKYSPELDAKHGETLPLLSHVEAESWLAERLKQHGHDIYAGGPYDTYADRLGACIVRVGVQTVVVGRGPAGKPETYQQAWERLYKRKLPVPRESVAGENR